jgi:hypothetical protein
MKDAKYIGLDVYRATISAVAQDCYHVSFARHSLRVILHSPSTTTCDRFPPRVGTKLGAVPRPFSREPSRRTPSSPARSLTLTLSRRP